MTRWRRTLRTFAVLAVICFWIGGFTFYAGVVIPVGAQVLHSHARQGRITQQVSGWLNLSGTIALMVLLWDLLATWRGNSRWLNRLFITTWIGMAAAMIALVLMHPTLDHLIGPGMELVDADRFDSVHRYYVVIATAQWGAGVVHVLGLAYATSEPRAI